MSSTSKLGCEDFAKDKMQSSFELTRRNRFGGLPIHSSSCEIGGPVNGTVVRASAKGMLKRKIKETRCSKQGPGPTLPVLTKDWSRYMLERM